MSGNRYLLDTNFIIGILKSNQLVLAEVLARQILVGECAYSAISQMELLSFSGIAKEEESLIREKLFQLTYLPLTSAVEDMAILLRQIRIVKLPDAIIAATALTFSLELLTLDKRLLAIVQAGAKLA